MAEVSAIEWTDATVNFWWGCRKVGPGCDHCYAETLAKRFGIHDYEKSGIRRKIAGAVKLIRRLQRGADKFEAKHGRRRRVFIQSMSDFFDNEIDPAWRAEAWAEIVAADRLDIQLVTKRVSNVKKMIYAAAGHMIESGGGQPARWPSHVGLIATVVNQDEANRDVPRLLDAKRALSIPWVGLSIEPMLGPIDLTLVSVRPPDGIDYSEDYAIDALQGRLRTVLDGPSCPHPSLDWVIVGGESGRDARPISPLWVRDLRDACHAAGVPFLFKQWGEWEPGLREGARAYAFGDYTHDRSSMIVTEHWPRQFTIFGARARMSLVGKKAAGRSLDGRTHDGFPVAA